VEPNFEDTKLEVQRASKWQRWELKLGNLYSDLPCMILLSVNIVCIHVPSGKILRRGIPSPKAYTVQFYTHGCHGLQRNAPMHTPSRRYANAFCQDWVFSSSSIC
jgi:hypothetical protein